MSGTLWTQKHAPKSLDEFLGNSQAVRRIIAWVTNWRNEKKKALLIYGPPGVGKTTLMPLLAKKFNYHLIETNASDVRSGDVIRDKFEKALSQASLFYKGRLMVFDEVDGIASSEDRGASKEIMEIINTTKYPVILIANDVYAPALRNIKERCELVEFRKIDSRSILKRLKEILVKEGVEYDEAALATIARNANGDLKAAINDLQLVAEGKRRVALADLTAIGYRDVEKNIFDALRMIFKTESAQVANMATANLDKDPDEFMLWIRENVPLEYEKQDEVALAYNFISRADVFRGRITRQQYWRYLVYVLQLLSVGVAMSKHRKYRKFTKYRYPAKLKRMVLTKQMRAEINELLDELAKKTHTSRRVARSYLPLVKLMAKKDRRLMEKYPFL